MINRPGSGLLIVVLSVVLPRVPNTSEGGQTPLALTPVPPSGSILVGFYRIFLDPFCRPASDRPRPVFFRLRYLAQGEWVEYRRHRYGKRERKEGSTERPPNP